MIKRVTFDPTLGDETQDKSNGKEWRQENRIQKNSTARIIDEEEINSPKRKIAAEEAEKTAISDAGLQLKKAQKSYANLLDLAENSNERNSR